MHNSYHFGLHARLQMQRRHISSTAIEEVLATPDSVIVGNYGRTIYQKLIVHQGSRKLFRIVVELNSLGEQELVTLYLTSKIGKYMGEH